MTEHARRTVLKAAGVSILAVGAAGCLSSDDADGSGSGDDDRFEIEPGTEIVLEGYASNWEGVRPAAIDGEKNPTLVLTDGEEYAIEWVNADGVTHDLQIRDEDGDVVDDLATDTVGSEGDGATLEFTATPEMVGYRCSYHGNQTGDIVVE